MEALRLGAECFASDLNPVACLIEKVLLEDVPARGMDFVEKVRTFSLGLKERVGKELMQFYPLEEDGGRPSAYIWGRCVRCEAPNCGAEIPLVRTFWLCKKAGRKRALRPVVERLRNKAPRLTFEVFEPESDQDVQPGTMSHAKATCLVCGTTLSQDRVKAQLRDAHGCVDVAFDGRGRRLGGPMIMAVVTSHEDISGVSYRIPEPKDYNAVWNAQRALKRLIDEWERGKKADLRPVPDEPLPAPPGKTGPTSGAYYNFMPLRLYGFEEWGDLFTARQKLALTTIVNAIRQGKSQEPEVLETTAFLLGRIADKNASLVAWDVGRETIGHVFSRQALPVVWDFVESSFADSGAGLLDNAVTILVNILERQAEAIRTTGQVHLADATSSPLPDASAAVWFTDPPYYDAIPYSDLSDFFLVWLRRALPRHPLLRDPFDSKNPLSPKSREIIDSLELLRGVPKEKAIELGLKVKDKAFYEDSMAHAFSEGRRILRDDGVGAVVFAHKTTEGWEALLSGIVRGGWVITGSWPIATERPGRLRSLNSATLATSVHLVCRPRPPNASIGDWADVSRELPARVERWMTRLTEEGVRGADLVFACIGPAMEVYSRYSKVVDAQDREVPLGGDPTASEPCEQGFLAKVWEVVGRIALEQVLGGHKGGSSALEEDARLTALFLWALQSSTEIEGMPSNGGDETEEDESGQAAGSGGFALVYDVVRRFAQPLGIHLDAWEGRIIETKGETVRLLSIMERLPQLFSNEDSQKLSTLWEETPRGRQLTLFPEQDPPPKPKNIHGRGQQKATGSGGISSRAHSRSLTTLDRLHMAMILQSNGASGPLRTLLREEKQRGPDFDRLARSLTALYPKDSEERRLIEALSLVIPK